MHKVIKHKINIVKNWLFYFCFPFVRVFEIVQRWCEFRRIQMEFTDQFIWTKWRNRALDVLSHALGLFRFDLAFALEWMSFSKFTKFTHISALFALLHGPASSSRPQKQDSLRLFFFIGKSFHKIQRPEIVFIRLFWADIVLN